MTVAVLPANQIPVSAGDAILCPPDENFGLAGGHLGLGYALALRCVDRGRWAPERLDRLRGGAGAQLSQQPFHLLAGVGGRSAAWRSSGYPYPR